MYGNSVEYSGKSVKSCQNVSRISSLQQVLVYTRCVLLKHPNYTFIINPQITKNACELFSFSHVSHLSTEFDFDISNIKAKIKRPNENKMIVELLKSAKVT